MHKIILYTLFILSSLNTATMELSTEETIKLSTEKTFYHLLGLLQTLNKFKELNTKLKQVTEFHTSQNVSTPITQPILHRLTIETLLPPHHNIQEIMKKSYRFNAFRRLQETATTAQEEYCDNAIDHADQIDRELFFPLKENLIKANTPPQILFTINQQTTPPTIDYYTFLTVKNPVTKDSLIIPMRIPNPDQADAFLLNAEIFSEQ